MNTFVSSSTIDLVHNQVISYLKQKIPNNPIIYFHNCIPYFFQESLNDNQYKATIILNGYDCYYVCIWIENIEDKQSPIDFTLLKQVDL